jgi:hypothetical protein
MTTYLANLNANEWERDGSGENGLELRGVLRSNWRRTEVWLKSLSPNQIVDHLAAAVAFLGGAVPA